MMEAKLLKKVQFGETITERNEIMVMSRRRIRLKITLTNKGITEDRNGTSATNCDEKEVRKEEPDGEEAEWEKTGKLCEIKVRQSNGQRGKIEN